MAAAFAAAAWPAQAEAQGPAVNDIVLVHGARSDGTDWKPVYVILTARGYDVSVVTIRWTDLAQEVATTMKAIALHGDRPVVLVGHSFGGVVITAAGTAANVVGLVYVAAFAPDTGESIGMPPAGGETDALPGPEGPLSGEEVFAAPIGEAAWHTRPSWYLVATDDQVIAPDDQRRMAERAGATTIEVEGTHFVHRAAPETVADFIELAARSAAAGWALPATPPAFDRMFFAAGGG